jgi:hypothetical protein
MADQSCGTCAFRKKYDERIRPADKYNLRKYKY